MPPEPSEASTLPSPSSLELSMFVLSESASLSHKRLANPTCSSPSSANRNPWWIKGCLASHVIAVINSVQVYLEESSVSKANNGQAWPTCNTNWFHRLKTKHVWYSSFLFWNKFRLKSWTKHWDFRWGPIPRLQIKTDQDGTQCLLYTDDANVCFTRMMYQKTHLGGLNSKRMILKLSLCMNMRNMSWKMCCYILYKCENGYILQRSTLKRFIGVYSRKVPT